MPEIARFYGIVVKIYFRDHAPPHFHASYAEHVAVFNMRTLHIMEGNVPKRAHTMLLEWARMNQAELLTMWESQKFHKLPPLE